MSTGTLVARRTISDIASPTSITAAATPVDTTKTTARVTASDKRTAEAWEAYDRVGELRYVFERTANSLSRVGMYAADIDATGAPSADPTTNPTAAAIVADIAGGPAGRATLIKKIVVPLMVTGECWVAVINRAVDGTDVEEWHVLDTDEISKRAGTITLHLQDDTDHDFNPDTDLLTRIHRPHPRNSRRTDSPTLSSLDVLKEIITTTAAIHGAGKSRLAGNGIILLPSEMSMPVEQAPTADPDAPGLPVEQPTMETRRVSATEIMAQLQQVMTTAIRDQSSAAAMVPIVLQAPAESIKDVRHIKFESEVTATNLDTRDRAIRRLSLSLDVPPEILTGVGGTNHWNAWAISEDTINLHFAPLMTLICDALTDAILRPLLRRHDIDPSGFTVWFDLTDLARNPDRGEDAVAAFDRGVISAAALRRELGFDDTDAPEANLSDTELRALAIQMVSKAPSLLPMLAPILGIDIPDVPAAGAVAPAPPDPTPAPAAPRSRS